MPRWLLAAVVVAVTAGCTSASHLSTGPLPRPLTSPTMSVATTGYLDDESFCSPSHGRIDYVVKGHEATLRLQLHRLIAHGGLAVDWRNAHTPRGYLIASFRTTSDRTPRAGSLRMFRGGETRGSRLYLTDTSDHRVAVLRRC